MLLCGDDKYGRAYTVEQSQSALTRGLAALSKNTLNHEMIFARVDYTHTPQHGILHRYMYNGKTIGVDNLQQMCRQMVTLPCTIAHVTPLPNPHACLVHDMDDK